MANFQGLTGLGAPLFDEEGEVVEQLWHKPADEYRDLLRLTGGLDAVLLVVVQQEHGEPDEPRLACERCMEEGFQAFDYFLICGPTIADDPQRHEHLVGLRRSVDYARQSGVADEKRP